MALPPEANIVEGCTFSELSHIIRRDMEDGLHRRHRPPIGLTLYLNARLAADARQPENGTVLIAWARAQGTQEVSIRVDSANKFLTPEQCAYWLRWN